MVWEGGRYNDAHLRRGHVSVRSEMKRVITDRERALGARGWTRDGRES